MSATAFSGIIGAVVALLAQAPAVAASVDRVKLRPVSEAKATAVTVRPVNSQCEVGIGYGTGIKWESTFAVECYGKGNTTTAPDLIVDPVLAGTFERLASDPTLGGRVSRITPEGVNWEFDVDGQATACATLFFKVAHATSGSSLA